MYFHGLEFDINKFHINTLYNIDSDYFHFKKAKLVDKCYGELSFIYNEETTGELKHLTIRVKEVVMNRITFEEAS